MSSVKSPSMFSQALGGLFMEDRFSDVTIVCQNVTFKAHRAIICTQCPFFDAALKHDFQESISGTINLPDDDPETIRRVLCFLYQQSYNDNDQDAEPTNNRPGNSMIILGDVGNRKAIAYNNLSVYLAADKFGILPLMQLASRKLSAWIRDNYMASSFPEIALQIMRSNLPHDPSLINVLVEIISNNLDELGCNMEILQLLRHYGQLACLIIERIVEKEMIAYRRAHCHGCQQHFNVTKEVSLRGFRCGNCRAQDES